MEEIHIPIPEFMKKPDWFHVQAWFDWFCKDHSLPGRTKRIMPKLRAVLMANGVGCRFDPRTSYVIFKNNCPVNGELYDDFRICDIKTGDVLYTVTPRSGHKVNEGQASVWGEFDSFGGHDKIEPLIEGSWKDVLAFFEGRRERCKKSSEATSQETAPAGSCD